MFARNRLVFDSGGVECVAYLYSPPTASAGSLPCVVTAHGGGGTMANLFPTAERFTAAGMATPVFDYRHYGESGGQPRQLMDTERQREDWHAAIRLARSCPGVDPSLKPFFDALQRDSPTWRNAFTPRVLLHAPRYREGTAERLTMPLLVCVADGDVNASPRFAEYAASRAPHREVKHYQVGPFDVYRGLNPAVFEQVMADEIAFLQTHLLPAAQEAAPGPVSTTAYAGA
jgi:hypothetical protein